MYALPPATGRSSIIRVTHTPLIPGPRTPRTSSTQHGAPSIYSITKLSLLYSPCCFAQYCIFHTTNHLSCTTTNPCLQIKRSIKRNVCCSIICSQWYLKVRLEFLKNRRIFHVQSIQSTSARRLYKTETRRLNIRLHRRPKVRLASVY